MRARKMFAGAVLLATIVMLGTVLTGQSPPPPRPLLVSADFAGHVTAWRAVASGFEKVWESRPRLAEAGAKPTGNVFSGPAVALAIADCDGDGTNDVVAMDMFGVTIYGAKPAYYAFEKVTEPPSPALAVGDIDGDGTPEILVQRVFGSGADIAREITALRVSAAGVTAVAQLKVPQYGSSVAVGDVDNDKQNEILSGGGDGITILKRRKADTWEPVATIPLMDAAGTIVVGDVDKDNKNEIVCATSSRAGKIAVYKYRKSGDRVAWPVMWQSPSLMTEGLQQTKSTGRPFCTVPDVAVADVDGDGQNELVAASIEYGKLGEEELTSSGRMHVFKFDGQSEFKMVWVSDRARGAWAPGVLGAGDLDGDGVSDVAHYGRRVFKHAAGAKGYEAAVTGCSDCVVAAIGNLGELREPAAAARVVPVAWTVPGSGYGQIVEGQTADVAVTLRSVWAEAKNVTVKLSSSDAGLEVSAATTTTTAIPAGGTVTVPGLQLKGRKAGSYALVNIDIASADGYRQTIPTRVMVGSPLPTYKPATEATVAEALEKARDENQRVLIVWGVNADKTSQAFLESTVKNGDLSHELSYEYQVVRADVSSSQRVASKYGVVVKHGALPHLTVLTADGKVLLNEAVATTKPAQPVLAGSTVPPPFDAKKVVETLKKFEAPPQDARQMVKAALDRARTESKTVFIWFSAPW